MLDPALAAAEPMPRTPGQPLTPGHKRPGTQRICAGANYLLGATGSTPPITTSPRAFDPGHSECELHKGPAGVNSLAAGHRPTETHTVSASGDTLTPGHPGGETQRSPAGESCVCPWPLRNPIETRRAQHLTPGQTACETQSDTAGDLHNQPQPKGSK